MQPVPCVGSVTSVHSVTQTQAVQPNLPSTYLLSPTANTAGRYSSIYAATALSSPASTSTVTSSRSLQPTPKASTLVLSLVPSLRQGMP